MTFITYDYCNACNIYGFVFLKCLNRHFFCFSCSNNYFHCPICSFDNSELSINL